MAVQWEDIFSDVDGPPVRGLPCEFTAVSTAYLAMAQDAEDVVVQFSRITGVGAAELRGQAATAFERFVRDVKDSLGDLPRVSRDASSRFSTHAGSLSDLRDAADVSLARARTAWDQLHKAEADLESANARSRALHQQMERLPPPGTDPQSDAEAEQLANKSRAAGTDADRLTRMVSDHRDTLNGCRRAWTAHHGDEADLRRELRDGLDSLDLGSLEDPGKLRSLCESVGGFLGEFIADFTLLDEFAELLAAIVEGDWATALWKLREILDVVLLVIAVVALFTPLGPLVAAIALGLAALKLVVDITLYAQKWPNPENGQVINGWDLVLDVIGVGAAGWTAKLAFTGKEGLALFQMGERLNKLRTTSDVWTKAQILDDLKITNSIDMKLVELTIVDGFEEFIPVSVMVGNTVTSGAWRTFGFEIGKKVIGAGLTVNKATKILPTISRPGNSTEVFPAIRNGHGPNDSAPPAIIAHLLPAALQPAA